MHPSDDLATLVRRLIEAQRASEVVAVVLDWSNVYHGAKRLSDGRINLDYIKLRDRVADGRFVADTLFCYQTWEPSKTRLLDHLGRHQFTCIQTVTGAKIAQEIGDRVLEMTRQRPRISTVVLIAGDGSYTHLADSLRKEGVRCEVSFFGKDTALALKNAACKFTDLGPWLDDLRLSPS